MRRPCVRAFWAIFIAILSVCVLTSCVGNKIKRQIAETNDELPIRLYDGVTVTSVQYGSGYSNDDKKAICINLHVEDAYVSSFFKIKANCSSKDFRELKAQTLLDMKFNRSLKTLIELAAKRKYSIILRFQYRPRSITDLGFWDLK